MSSRGMVVVVVGCLVTALSSLAAQEPELILTTVLFPDGKKVDVPFERTDRAPEAALSARVEYEDERSEIDLRYRDLEPAVVFGGDVTCYVVWAIGQDGTVDNLGDLGVRDDDGKARFATALQRFALIVTAEAYERVPAPSQLVVFRSGAPSHRRASTAELAFSGLVEPPAVATQSAQGRRWHGDRPLEMLQAEKAYEIAGRFEAETHAPDVLRQARIALAQAKNLATSSRTADTALEYAQRAITLANDAIGISRRKLEEQRLEAAIAARRREMAELEHRAEQAEQARLAAQQARETARLSLEQAKAELERTELRRTEVEYELAEMRSRVSELAADHGRLVAERKELSVGLERLREEKQRLRSRLQGALSEVAETRESARGLIVDLPDILFDVDRSELKSGAKVVLAKLAGILLIMDELQLSIEGHTDATGGAAHNLRLSQDRADAVFDFLHEQGIASERMAAVGFGEDRPMADNETDEGRRKNRRVEIVIGRGDPNTPTEGDSSAAPPRLEREETGGAEAPDAIEGSTTSPGAR